MPDVFPTYQQVNADGELDPVFPGGLTILAGNDATPPDSRQIRWIAESDGSLVANIEAYEDIDDPFNPVTGVGMSTVNRSNPNSHRASISASTVENVGFPQFDNASVRASARAPGKFPWPNGLIMDAVGNSSFLQFGGALAEQGSHSLSYANFTAAGVGNFFGTFDIGCSHPAVGLYTITLNWGVFPSQRIMTGGCHPIITAHSASEVRAIAFPTPNSFTINLMNSAGANIDSSFEIFVIAETLVP